MAFKIALALCVMVAAAAAIPGAAGPGGAWGAGGGWGPGGPWGGWGGASAWGGAPTWGAAPAVAAAPAAPAANPWIPPWISAAPWFPQWGPCSMIGSTCLDCNTKLVCTKMGGLQKACSDPTLPNCNLGACSATPSEECAPVTSDANAADENV